MTQLRLFVLTLALVPTLAVANLVDPDFYLQRYGLEDTNEKLINNHGEGFEELYGIRNFRVVLHGVLYRSGANNKWHRRTPRANDNPLQIDGLTNLCEEGFSKSVYLYRKGYKDSPKNVKCSSIRGQSNELDYLQMSTLASPEIRREFLELVYDVAMNTVEGPVLAHCWNGWHASGYAAAVSLMQFCGWDAQKAVAYWDLNTDGHNTDPNYDKIRKKIHGFETISELKIPKDIADKICPVSYL